VVGWLKGATCSVVPAGIVWTISTTSPVARIAGSEASAQVWHVSTDLSGGGQPSSVAADSDTTSTIRPLVALQTWKVVTIATAKAQNSRSKRIVADVWDWPFRTTGP
jgi:hypothetical protein